MTPCRLLRTALSAVCVLLTLVTLGVVLTAASDFVAAQQTIPQEEIGIDSQLADENATVENVTVWTAPRSALTGLDSRSAIVTARRNGRLTRDRTVARTDAFVLTLRIDGIADRVAAASGDTETARFHTAIGETNGTLTLVQTNPNAEQRAKVGNLLDTGSTTVVTDPDNNTYHLVVSLTQVPVGRDTASGYCWGCGGSGGTLDVRAGDRYGLNVTVAGETFLFEPDEPPDPYPDAGTLFEVVEPETQFGTDGLLDRVTLPSESNARVTARTSRAPGTRVAVEINNRSDGGPPLTRWTRVVERDGDTGVRGRFEPPRHEITTTMNTSGLPIGTTFNISLGVGTETVARESGVVRETNASVTLPAEETWRDGAIQVRSATLPDGGFLVVQAGTGDDLASIGSYRYAGDVTLGGVTYRNITIPVETASLDRLSEPLRRSATVVAVVDTNGNQQFDDGDRPYVRNGTAVADVTQVQNPRPAPTSVGPDTPSMTVVTANAVSTTETVTESTTTASQTQSPVGPTATAIRVSTGETTSETSDGFGVVIAVLAMVLFLSLANRQ